MIIYSKFTLLPFYLISNNHGTYGIPCRGAHAIKVEVEVKFFELESFSAMVVVLYPYPHT